MRYLAIALLLCATTTAAQQIDPHQANGRIESLSSSLNAVANECANQRGLLLSNAAAEITKLQDRIKELEAKLPKPEPDKK